MGAGASVAQCLGRPPDQEPGWQETAIIAAGGVALAALLWDGPVFVWLDAEGPREGPSEDAVVIAEPTFAQMLEAGCVTQADLTALREGKPMAPDCILVRYGDGTVAQRPPAETDP